VRASPTGPRLSLSPALHFRPISSRDPLDQTPAFDPFEPDPVPGFEFDQSAPDELDS
jgi:hypothetical protein